MSNALKKLAIGLTALTAFNTAQANDNTTDAGNPAPSFFQPQSELHRRISSECSQLPLVDMAEGRPRVRNPLNLSGLSSKGLTVQDFLSAAPAEREAMASGLKKEEQEFLACASHVVNHLQR